MKSVVLKIAMASIFMTVLVASTSQANIITDRMKSLETDVLENLWNWREAIEVSSNSESGPKQAQIKAIEMCLDALDMGKMKLASHSLKRLQYLPQHEIETRAALRQLWESVSNDRSGLRGKTIALGIRKCLGDFNSLSERDRQSNQSVFGNTNQ